MRFFCSFLFLISFTYRCAIAQPDIRPVKLGAVLPLSGDLAYYGNEIKNGLVLAQLHSAHPVELVLEDAPLLGNQILSAFEKLVKVHRIDCLAGNFSNQGMLLMSPGIDRYQIPSFHTAAADDQILGASDWIFTSNVRTADEARAVAEYAFNSLRARRAAVLAIETSFGAGYRKAFISRFQELGGHVVADEQQQTTGLDVRTQMLKVRGAKPDVVFLATFGPYLGMAARQLRQLGVGSSLLTVYEVEDPSVVATAGKDALQGIRYFVSYAENREFEQNYRAHFGAEPQTFARNAYDAARLLVDTTVRCNFERQCAKAQLYRVRGYQGVSGSFDIDADGGTRKSLHLHQYRDGAFRVDQQRR
jgi:branched-chain amino acid transport system substrate-binding protein